ncbi:hypothetical protein C0989_009493, partial [Termitomyces sp. Mn162]
ARRLSTLLLPFGMRFHWLLEESVLCSPLQAKSLDGRGTPAEGRGGGRVSRTSRAGVGTGAGCRGGVGIARGRPKTETVEQRIEAKQWRLFLAWEVKALGHRSDRLRRPKNWIGWGLLRLHIGFVYLLREKDSLLRAVDEARLPKHMVESSNCIGLQLAKIVHVQLLHLRQYNHGKYMMRQRFRQV